MPFPVTKLAYGDLVRLGELSFPAERYNLQVAAGNFNICPPKFQKTKKTDFAFFFNSSDTGEVDVEGAYDQNEPTLFLFDGNNLTECNDKIVFDQFDCEALESNAMKHVILSPKDITLDDCDMSTKFLTKLSTMIHSFVHHIDIEDLSAHHEYTLKDFFMRFPEVKTMRVNRIDKPLFWLDDLVNTPECKLQKLTMKGTFEGLITFSVDDLANYVQTRDSYFFFMLELTTDFDTALIEKFNKLVKGLSQKLEVRSDTTGQYFQLRCYKKEPFYSL